MQVVVQSPKDGHCILHSVIIQTGSSIKSFIESLKQEIHSNNYQIQYKEFMEGKDGEDRKAHFIRAMDLYSKTGNHQQNSLDIIFPMLANILGAAVIVHDPHFGDDITFPPTNTNEVCKAVYLSRQTREHYNALIPKHLAKQLIPQSRACQNAYSNPKPTLLHLTSCPRTTNFPHSTAQNQLKPKTKPIISPPTFEKIQTPSPPVTSEIHTPSSPGTFRMQNQKLKTHKKT